jgi:hypothetical protein
MVKAFGARKVGKILNVFQNLWENNQASRIPLKKATLIAYSPSQYAKTGSIPA